MNFALTWGFVRRHGGELWLRFDDVDQDRCDQRYIDSTKQVLSYLGFDWDHELAQQITHIERYRKLLHEIPHYFCDCSRLSITKRTGGHHYDGHCRERELLSSPGNGSVRFKHPTTPQKDFILWRREDLPAYHLTSLADDQEMGVTHIIRGADLIESTEVQQEISRSLADDPLHQVCFYHHPLILSAQGEKLSKSRGQGDLIQRIQAGYSAREIWQELGQLIGIEVSQIGDWLTLNTEKFLR
jgi:glutamyl/glutaminyl-tRNA synthetase